MSPEFMHHFQDTLLENSPKSFIVTLRGYHPLRRLFPEDLRSDARIIEEVSQHHISTTLLQRIQFALFCVHSPLLTESQLVSLPAGTEMFHFPAFLLLSELL